MSRKSNDVWNLREWNFSAIVVKLTIELLPLLCTAKTQRTLSEESFLATEGSDSRREHCRSQRTGGMSKGGRKRSHFPLIHYF